MTTKTYSQFQAEIQALQDQAKAAHAQESGEVIRKMQDAIRVYGITPQDLFGKAYGTSKAVKAGSTAVPKAGLSGAAKYSDGVGGTWVGRGPRPQWLRDALASGRHLEEFAAGATPPSTGKSSAPVAPAPAAKKAVAKKSGKPSAKAAKGAVAPATIKKYQDGQGNGWSGRGPQPGWLKKGIAAGKTLEDFLA